MQEIFYKGLFWSESNCSLSSNLYSLADGLPLNRNPQHLQNNSEVIK